MSIYCGNSLAECTAPALPLPRYPSLYQEGLTVLRRGRVTLGVRVRLVSVPSLGEPSSAAQTPGGGSGAREDARLSLSGSEGAHVGQRDIYFGDTVQDVIAALGAPARIFYKSEDKMKIHSPNAHRKGAAQKSDYFYNYYTLGFVSAFSNFHLSVWNNQNLTFQDILFDARTNAVKKFILHTNFPGHYNFNM